MAIALMYREDYAHAGFKMLPDFDADGRFTRAEIIGCTIVLIVVTMFPLAGRVAPLYLLAMAGAGLFFLYYGAKLAASASRNAASRLVHASVIYLPVVLAAMMIHKA